MAKRIEFAGISRPKAVDRFIEKRIADWLRSHLTPGEVDLSPNALDYEVAFAREGHGHLIDCFVEIHAGARVWQGSSLGNGTQQALIHSLEHLVAVPA